MFECCSCDFKTESIGNLGWIGDCIDRINAGDIMPAGECPVCDEFCYAQKPDKNYSEYELNILKNLVAFKVVMIFNERDSELIPVDSICLNGPSIQLNINTKK